MSQRNLLGRRALLAACVVVPAVAVSGGSASAAPIGSAMPGGFRRGTVVDTDQGGATVYEVLDGEGEVVGYSLDDDSRKVLDDSAPELQRQFDRVSRDRDYTSDSPLGIANRQQAAAAGSGLECGAAVALFIGTTVFPTARVAKLAARLAGLVKKHGVSKFVRILTGAVKISDNSMKKTFLEIAGALTGISSLGVCVPIFEDAVARFS